MRISRHMIQVGARRVHYRRAGAGPPLLLVHQSPRSSAEYAPLMARWAAHFTLIAPDTPGFGQSDPLPIAEPVLADFADALVETMDAIGLGQVGAYGFHSGGIILATTARRHPERFTALGIGGYAIWTEEERALFAGRYLPPFLPSDYGEHLVWLWNRMREQSWFFPWFAVRPEARLPNPHADPARIDATIREMLDSGDAYRVGYGAVLAAPRDLPGPDEPMPPALIAAYDGDPLQSHIDRLGALPPGWRAEKVADPPALEAAMLAHLMAHPAPPARHIAEAEDEGFVPVRAGGFDGLIHWRGQRDAARLVLHAPGQSTEQVDDPAGLVIDLPGHGLSDGWPDGVAPTLDDWVEAIAASIAGPVREVAGVGLSALLALAVARRLGVAAAGIDARVPADAARWIGRLPDLTPDPEGGYLLRAWSMVRIARLFWPWFDVGRANAIPFDPATLDPAALARDHRALIRARAAAALHDLLLAADRDALAGEVRINRWDMADWARARADVWRPASA